MRLPPSIRCSLANTLFKKPSSLLAEEGLSLLITIIALVVFSLLGLYMSLNAGTEVRISDNYESRIQAGFAARAGLNHTLALIRGVRFNDVLRGPDGVGTSTYPSTASGRYAFRNPLDWSTARSLNILNPVIDVSSDDGVINSGWSNGTPGTPLIPSNGISLKAPDPYSSGGTVTTARYFVKVTDNPEDCDNDPFTDCDRIIIVRSMGVAPTIRETGGGTVRANSVVTYEARYRELKIFDLNVPFAIQGDNVLPASSNMFNGQSFRIDGRPGLYGIGTIDTNTSNNIYPSDEVKKGFQSSDQYDQVRGACCPETEPAIGDITAGLTGDQSLLLNPSFLWNVAYNLMPNFADNIYQGNQKWSSQPVEDLGSYDSSKPIDDPAQRFKVTYVNGDLDIHGNVRGAGILFVTGKLSLVGTLNWAGVTIITGGYMNLNGNGATVEGNLYLVSLQPGNPPTFGTPQVTVSGSSKFSSNSSLLRLVMRQLPPMEISRREITSSMDP